MPRFDKTGPRGEGSMTGRCLGHCGRNTAEQGKGFGRGKGLRLRHKRGYGQTKQNDDQGSKN